MRCEATEDAATRGLRCRSRQGCSSEASCSCYNSKAPRHDSNRPQEGDRLQRLRHQAGPKRQARCAAWACRSCRCSWCRQRTVGLREVLGARQSRDRLPTCHGIDSDLQIEGYGERCLSGVEQCLELYLCIVFSRVTLVLCGYICGVCGCSCSM
jgi:hypothetical protein